MYLTCQVRQSILQSLSNGSPITVNDPSRPEEESRGCPICDPAPARGIGVGAAGSRPRGPRDRLLHIAITDSEEGAPRAEPHRHLCPDRQVLEAPERGAGETGGPAAQGRIEAGIWGRARALVSRSPRADPAQVQARETRTRPRDL